MTSLQGSVRTALSCGIFQRALIIRPWPRWPRGQGVMQMSPPTSHDLDWSPRWKWEYSQRCCPLEYQFRILTFESSVWLSARGSAVWLGDFPGSPTPRQKLPGCCEQRALDHFLLNLKEIEICWVHLQCTSCQTMNRNLEPSQSLF